MARCDPEQQPDSQPLMIPQLIVEQSSVHNVIVQEFWFSGVLACLLLGETAVSLAGLTTMRLGLDDIDYH
jgi:hypothetical protein